MKVGIIGAGAIAGTMAGTIREMDCAQNYAVAARDYGRAAEFAQTYGFEKAYGSYEELVEDAGVELVYIATPHSHHYEHIKLCLNHGKHVLCEKSFTVNESQAREVLALAREKKLLLTEAIWTRYMPMRKTYKDGKMAALCSSAMGLSDRRGIIYGDNGFIEVENINNCEGIRVYDRSRNMIASYDTPKQISGYEYEVEACLRAIKEGALECPEMPHEETLRMMGWMDELRRQWGLVYPMER